jgi:hypothetical protein
MQPFLAPPSPFPVLYSQFSSMGIVPTLFFKFNSPRQFVDPLCEFIIPNDPRGKEFDQRRSRCIPRRRSPVHAGIGARRSTASRLDTAARCRARSYKPSTRCIMTFIIIRSSVVPQINPTAWYLNMKEPPDEVVPHSFPGTNTSHPLPPAIRAGFFLISLLHPYAIIPPKGTFHAPKIRQNLWG